ncbi:MAG TPA: 30S ribosomal protein S8 [Patescibacteria group bacterium]
MVGYPVGDFLIRFKNAARANLREVTTPETKLVKELAGVLKAEGYAEKVETKDGEVKVILKFHKKEPLLINLKLVSKPGLRIYMKLDDLKKRKPGASILILSTPLGLLSSKKAVKRGVGGEVIAEVW